MNSQAIRNSERVYAYFLKFYPKSYRQEFAKEMQFVFSESLKDAYSQRGEHGITTLWGRTFIDVFRCVIVEHIENQQGGVHMNSNRLNPNRSALASFLLFLPVVLFILSAVFNVEIVRDALTVDGVTNTLGRIVMGICLFILLPASFIVSLRPLLDKGNHGKRKFYLLNFILAVTIAIPIVLILYGFAEEMYRCEVLQIPNCD